MKKYQKVIDKVFEDLAEVDGTREEYEQALALLWQRASETCEMEGIDPSEAGEFEDDGG